MPTWSCPTPPISSAGTASRCSTGRSPSADGPADAIRQPVVAPDRDVRAVPGRAARSRRAAGLPGFVDRRRHAEYPGGYPDYIVNHERSPGIGPLAGWRGADGDELRHGRAESATSSSATSRTAASTCTTSPPTQRYFKHANRAYLDWADGHGLHRRTPTPIMFQLYLRAAAEVPARGARPRRGAAAGERIASASRPTSIRCRSGIRRSRATTRQRRASRCTPSPSGRCTCITPGARRTPGCARSTAQNRLYMHRATRAQQLGLADDDWVWIRARIGRVKGAGAG